MIDDNTMSKLFDIWTGHGWEINIDYETMSIKKGNDIVVLVYNMNAYYASSDAIVETELFKRTMIMLEKSYKWKRVTEEEIRE